jgi:LPXTG-site transpeptidase (sortase) family protein
VFHRPASTVAFVAILGVVLAFTWSDGTPTQDPFAVLSQPSIGVAFQDPADNVYLDQNFAVPPIAEPAPPPQAPIPKSPPVQLLIPAINVHRAVEAVGVTPWGVMQLPSNSWNAGWYKGSPVPGAPGDAVIEGHAGYPDQPMIFGRLEKLRRGDRIVVVLGNGTRQLFLVQSMKRIPIGTAPSGMAEPYGLPRLTLVTCAGSFDKDKYSYSQRLVLEARYAGTV